MILISIPLSVRKVNDNRYWMVDDKGLYSVKSSYKIQQFWYDDGKGRNMDLAMEIVHSPKSSKLRVEDATRGLAHCR